MQSIKWLTGICLLWWCLSGSPARADVPFPSSAPAGEIALQIDPLRNRLIVLVDGIPYKKYPIALGRPDTPTPVGEWKVINKYKNWGSGFGTRWLGLNVPWGTYGIHGTNRPGSIGHDASHGCVRMFNKDVEELYEWVKIGTPVSILGHPLREPSLDPRRLAAGDVGSDVLLVQSRLQSAGFYYGPCNGRFSHATEQAMKRYEKAHGLPVDGVVSQHDYQALGLVE
ncbi:L,D-transpeptidase family protein [Effusibacillus pohliae]|uniref:L,D-transpeptidase family protein n=1 Tax=Effusibacillus pohliae TaxID=232270 RepID=UPI0003619869|nr:L,D-transpeptidase family protein [Effusibacillus pohliae]